MAKPIMLLTTIPFSGFYESLWSGELDREEESFAENFEGDRQAEDCIPAELRLTAEEVGSILFDVTDYRAAHESIAEDYAATFDAWAGDKLGMTRKAKRTRHIWHGDGFTTVRETYDADSIGLKFESLQSPREYNFTTDRIFCHVPLKTVRAMFKASAAEDHKRLCARIAERFTSYDGFHSFYRTELNAWLSKPVRDWDHNEVATLLEAMTGLPDTIEDMFYGMGDEFAYRALDKAVDWKRFDERVAELREEKAEELRAEDPEYVPPYRCTETPDLFRTA